MRSSLLGSASDAVHPFTLVNPRMLKATLHDSELLARQGAMTAYQGTVEFAYEGAGGLKRVLKKALTNEGVPLMRCRGTGEVYLARNSDELHIVDVDDGESLTVNGANVVAFDPALSWDIRAIEGATIMSGDVFNMVFTGVGRIVLSACGTPVVLDAGTAPTYADVQSAIAWSSALSTRLVRTAGAAALIGRGSGEAFQLAFEGQGFVVVQASEGPVVPKHSHKGVSEWLS